MKNNTIKAVIFDLDGTLVNTINDIGESMNRALKELNHPTHEINAYRYFVGWGVHELVTKAAPKDLTSGQFDSLIKQFRNHYHEHYDQSSFIYEGIPELISFFKTQKLSLNVLSNKPHHLTEKTIHSFFEPKTFDFIIGHRDNYPAKPDPVSALEISQNIQIDPADFLFIGDSHVDIETAKSAGMTSIGVTWGFISNKITQYKPDYLVGHPLDIIDLYQSGSFSQNN